MRQTSTKKHVIQMPELNAEFQYWIVKLAAVISNGRVSIQLTVYVQPIAKPQEGSMKRAEYS